MPLFAFDFWNRVDALKGDVKLSKIAEEIGINYQTLRNQRSDNRYPNREDMLALARYLNTSVDYLMTGVSSEAESSPSSSYEYVTKAMKEDVALADMLASLIKHLKG